MSKIQFKSSMHALIALPMLYKNFRITHLESQVDCWEKCSFPEKSGFVKKSWGSVPAGVQCHGVECVTCFVEFMNHKGCRVKNEKSMCSEFSNKYNLVFI